jgi:predicted outer membrane protein
MVRHILAGTLMMGLAAAPAFAGSKMPDEAFVMKAAMGGMAEVDLGKLAAEKATSGDVKKFGQRMADDHSKSNDDLKTLARNKHITLPTEHVRQGRRRQRLGRQDAADTRGTSALGTDDTFRSRSYRAPFDSSSSSMIFLNTSKG